MQPAYQTLETVTQERRNDHCTLVSNCRDTDTTRLPFRRDNTSRRDSKKRLSSKSKCWPTTGTFFSVVEQKSCCRWSSTGHAGSRNLPRWAHFTTLRCFLTSTRAKSKSDLEMIVLQLQDAAQRLDPGLEVLRWSLFIITPHTPHPPLLRHCNVNTRMPGVILSLVLLLTFYCNGHVCHSGCFRIKTTYSFLSVYIITSCHPPLGMRCKDGSAILWAAARP